MILKYIINDYYHVFSTKSTKKKLKENLDGKILNFKFKLWSFTCNSCKSKNIEDKIHIFIYK